MSEDEQRLVARKRVGRTFALRANSMAALVMIVLELWLGMWVNLYATLPAGDQGEGVLAAFGSAVASGPLGLSLHALLGTLLIVTGISAVVRAALLRRTPFIVLTSLGLLTVLWAWLQGARFVGTGASDASFGMALAAGLGLLCYAIVLLAAPPWGPGRPAATT